MSTRIGEARARLLGFADHDGEVDRLAAAQSTAVLPPMDEVAVKVDIDAYADPFASGNEGGFDLVWEYDEPKPPPATATSAPTRSSRSAGPSHESSRAVGRMWSNFSMSDAASAALGQLAG